MVELESKYAKEVASVNPNLERLERYSKMLNQLKSIFISEAHAADKLPKSFEETAKNFKDLMKRGDRCIYAGWVSRMSVAGTIQKDGTRVKRSLCLHPAFISTGNVQSSLPAETSAYQSDSSCTGRGKISCSPLIFGYKNESKRSLFCVKAGVESSGYSQADNSSLYCMREALKLDQDAGVDPVEKRLKYLRNAFKAKPEIYENVQKLIFQACICEGAKNNFNTKYKEYMRPHRTCYGMVQMMGETQCGEELRVVETEIFKKIREFVTTKIDNKSSDEEVDRTYSAFIKDIKNSAPKEYAAMCEGAPLIVVEDAPPKPPVVVPTPGVIPDPTPAAPGPEAPAPVDTLPELAVVAAKEKDYLCKAKCTLPPEKAEDKKPKPEEKAKDKPEAPKEEKTTEEKPEESKPEESKLTGVKCEFEVSEKIPGVDGKEDTTRSVKLATTPTELPTSLEQKNMSVSNKIDEKDVDLDCIIAYADKPAAAPAAPETEEEPELKLVPERKEATYDIKAEYDKKFDSYTLVWSLEKPKDLRVNEGWKYNKIEDDKKKDDKDKKDEDKEKEKKDFSTVPDDEPEVAPEKPKEEEKPVTPKTIRQTRVISDYKVCAKLVKGEKESKLVCTVVAKLPQALGPMGNGMQQMPRQIRMSTDTAAQGIR